MHRFGWWRQHSPFLVRIGIGAVFASFGVWQLLKYEAWIGFLPSFVTEGPLSAQTLITLNGALDLLVGLMLLLGLYLRLFAALGLLHLGGIVITMGFTTLAVRDIGLWIVLAAIFLHGPDQWSIDHRRLKRKKSQSKGAVHF